MMFAFASAAFLAAAASLQTARRAGYLLWTFGSNEQLLQEMQAPLASLNEGSP